VHVPANQYLSWSGFASPAPGGSYGTALSFFDGTNPNSTYSLYIEDLVRRDSGT
jgi:large repetitive protein